MTDEQQWDRFHTSLLQLPKDDINSSIAMTDGTVVMRLEAFEAIANHFKGNITYGLRNGDGPVFPLGNTDFSTARDIAEASGTHLMQELKSDWIEA